MHQHMRSYFISLFVLLLFVVLIWIPELHASWYDRLNQTVVVISADDSGAGTLRQALLEAQEGDIITFDPIVFPPTSPTTILLQNRLPILTIDALTIDASNAGVILDGNDLSGGARGFLIDKANGVTILGLQIVNFPRYGIEIRNGASNTIIGGDRSIGVGPLGQGNLISNNDFGGIALLAAGNNQILGNYIGTDITGTGFYENMSDRTLVAESTISRFGYGIFVASGASNNIIAGNLISGNPIAGVMITGSQTSQNIVKANYIGTDALGTSSVANSNGIIIQGGISNTIGAEIKQERNIISGNSETGVSLFGGAVINNLVIGNYIGTDSTGTRSLANGGVGVLLKNGAVNNIIGGTSTEVGNIISGNNREGIKVESHSTIRNQIAGNYIGTDASGSMTLENKGAGILITLGANQITVGGTTEGERNVISGNSGPGVSIEGYLSNENYIVGNYIGTDATGTVDIGNSGAGVLISDGATGNVIGGGTDGEKNVISGNQSQGVSITDNETDNNQVIGNYIGSDKEGNLPIGNNIGVQIDSDATGNVISGTLIAFNRSADMIVESTTGNLFERNVVQAAPTGRVENRWTLGNSLVDNDFSNSDFVLVTGNTLSEDQTWEAQGDLDTYLVVEDDLVIGSGVTLTVAEGVNVQFDFGLGAHISGTLRASGTSDEPIRFTSAQRLAILSLGTGRDSPSRLVVWERSIILI